VLRRRLIRPLGCTASLTLPQHMLLRRVAVGHEQVPGGEPTRQARWTLTRSNGPMGGIVCSAEDLLTFVRIHLEGGRGADGAEILTAAAVELMKEPQCETPIPGEEQALGWTRRRWGDAVCLGQDADTFGQRAFLRVVPERGFATCLFVNSPLGEAVARDVMPRLAGDLLDVDVGPWPQAASPAEGAEPGFDRSPYVGSYSRLHQRVVVAEASGNGLMLTTEPSGVLAALGGRRAAAPLRPLDPAHGTFVMTDPTTGVDQIVVFDRYRFRLDENADGAVVGSGSTRRRRLARSLHLAGRLHTRTA
jgi:CubicO group peptidase (beta-lactamase class C family)